MALGVVVTWSYKNYAKTISSNYKDDTSLLKSDAIFHYGMDQVLGKLFGSRARVKIMRLFLFNPTFVFQTSEIRKKSDVHQDLALAELKRLSSIGLIKKSIGSKKLYFKKGKKTIVRKRKTKGWALNKSFAYLDPIQSLLMSSESFRHPIILKRFNNVGRLKLLIVSGVFIQNEDSRIDILLVGDHLKRGLITRALKVLESEIGKELRCAIFKTADFVYRLGIYDRFVRDIIDYPHEKLIDKIGLRR